MVADGLPIERGAINLDAGRAWIAQRVSADHRRGGGRKRGTKMQPPTSAGIMATVSGLRGAKLRGKAGSRARRRRMGVGRAEPIGADFQWLIVFLI